jgi:glycosyltransferase involved in cell wall biosynthesis
VRILLTAPLLPQPAATAGGALVFYGLVEALATQHQVTVVCLAGASPTDGAGVDALSALGVTVVPVWRHATGGAAVLGRRLRLAARWLTTRDPLRALKFRDRAIQAALDATVAEASASGRAFDLVQVEDSAMGQYRYPPGIPRVLTEHEVRWSTTRGPHRARRWERYQRRVWQTFDRLIVFTDRDAAALRAIAPELAAKIRVNPFGVALGAPADRALEGEDQLVFVGGFRHAPNVDAALWLVRSILPLIRAQRPGARLTIVGADPPASVRALASEWVTVTGFVPDVQPYLEYAAVVIAPLRKGAGMRVKILQALACGKAVVTTSLGAEGLAGGAPVRIAESASELADAVVALLADAPARRVLGDRARSFVTAHHSWTGFSQRLAAVYRELGLDA